MSTRLVLYAHGSADAVWRRPFEALTRRLGAALGRERVALAYMEFCPPTLLDVARDALNDGITRVELLPLFLSAGGHVSRDVPQRVADVRAACPTLDVVVLPPVGEDPRFADLVQRIAEERLEPGG